MRQRLKLSWSQLYSDALAAYLSSRGPTEVTARLDAVHRGAGVTVDASRIATVVVEVITSNLALAEAPGNVRLGKSDSGLSRPSVVNVSQVVTLDRKLLSKRVRPVPGDAIRRVDEGLRLVLGL